MPKRSEDPKYIDPIQRIYEFSSYHRWMVEAASYVSCFYCFEISQTDKVKSWIDNGQTAMCPRCGIDAIIPGHIEIERLKAIGAYWFKPVDPYRKERAEEG